MISLVNIRDGIKQLGGKVLFDGLCCSVNEEERLAIIGANGAGKTTLLKIILGSEELDEGEVTRRRGMSVAVVAQQESFDPDSSVMDLLEAAAQKNDPNDGGAAAKALALARFDDPAAKVGTLSGGWRKRLAIVRGMIGSPDLLLLDEPTNHLDIEGIEWLEEIITSYSGTVCFISHDRYFIESCASRVLELDRRYANGVFAVDGNYSEFLERREQYFEQREAQQRTLGNRVRREVEWLRQGAKARTTKSRHRTDEALRLISELKSYDIRSESARIEFASSGKRSKELLRVEELGVSRGEKVICSNLTFVATPGTCFGIVGPNGSGKTSILKVLTGELKQTAGNVVRASRLSISVFDQTRESLNPNMLLQEALMGDSPSIIFNGVQYVPAAWAKRFLFNPEQLRLPLRSLSGGEQARVLIARLMREPSDILVLDEPTNDLDIPTLEVLERSIDGYPGSVFLVTHDRYLLDRCSSSVIGLLGEGRAEIFASYLQWEIAREGAAFNRTPAATAQFSKSDKPSGSRNGITYSEKIELNQIEKKILKAEADVKKIEGKLAVAGSVDRNSQAAIYNELATAQKAVEALYDRWAELDAKTK